MTNLLGVYLTLLVGPNVPVPAPPTLLEALQEIEVQHDEAQASTFQMTFHVGRSSPLDLVDFTLVANPLLLKPWNRVVILVTLGIVPQVLMDGFITHQQLAPGNEPGTSTLTVTGEDATVRMDMVEVPVEHAGLSENLIASKLLAPYAKYGVVADVKAPPTVDTPSPNDRTPVQLGSDLAYLRAMARRFGFVFYVTPGPAPGTSTAYWGPQKRSTASQGTLSYNLGHATNVERLDFSYSALRPVRIKGQVQDRSTNQVQQVDTQQSERTALASQPAGNAPDVRQVQFHGTGFNTEQATARAQGRTDAASDAVEGHGELDALRYGAILEARRRVDVRGVGQSYDGQYYVKSVTHRLRIGSYTQSFVLSRDGVGSLISKAHG
ncbi:MAG TPA: hypothetical protein VFE33_09765 [Thermoanaerobaculia bacterium]|nr:hypothetical protein [Thermoanaerobaculia bacterium]